MLFVGYTIDHPVGNYKIYNKATDSIVLNTYIKVSIYPQQEAVGKNKTVDPLLNTPSSTISINVSDSEDEDVVRPQHVWKSNISSSSRKLTFSDLPDSNDVQ